MSTKSIKSIVMSRPMAATLLWAASSIAFSQTVTLPVLTGQTNLQTQIGTAVATMCVNALDGKSETFTSTQEVDLHDQCHAIAGAVISSKGGTDTYQASALGALQQVSGNEISTQGALATRAVAGQFANISGRLTALRFGAGSSFTQGGGIASNSDDSGWSRGDALVAGSTPLDATQRSGLLNTALVADGSPQMARAESSGDTRNVSSASPLRNSPWGLFVQGSYTSGHHDITSDEDPFHFHAQSVTGGIDYNFGSAVLGGSIGYDDFDSSIDASGLNVSGGSAQVKSTSGSLYGAWFGQNWIFNGIATYGHLSTNVSRDVKYTAVYNTTAFNDPQPDLPPTKDNCVGSVCSVTVDRTLVGNPDGHAEAVGVTGGYQFVLASLNIFPSLSVNYRRATINSFTETDPNPPAGGDGLVLSYDDQTVESLRSILAVDLSRAFGASFGVITPIVRFEWDHEYKTGARSIEARYFYDPTRTTTCLSCFNLPTDSTPANYGIAGLGFSVVLAHRLQAFVYDEALIGYSDYRSNSLAVGIRGQF